MDVLARRARRVTGVDANPDAHEHARLKYTRPGVTFVRDLVETYEEPCDVVVFLQTIEHMHAPAAVLQNFRGMLRPRGTVYVSCATSPVRSAASRSVAGHRRVTGCCSGQGPVHPSWRMGGAWSR